MSRAATFMGGIAYSICILLLLSALIMKVATAQTDLEYEVKAGFMFNIARFTAWPPHAFSSPGDPLALCLIGRNPFGQTIMQLEGRRVDERPLSVRPATIESLPDCHILFVSRSEEPRVAQILTESRGFPILSIGDQDRFLERGGIVNLVVVDGRVRFQVNPQAAAQAGLRLSSRLLELAILVEQGD